MPKLVEVMDHVHLVVVAKAVCDIHPRALRGRYFRIECRLETRDTRKGFGRNANLVQESPFELAET